jgi:hypothetical protein
MLILENSVFDATPNIVSGARWLKQYINEATRT